jgi:hypothetical protein
MDIRNLKRTLNPYGGGDIDYTKQTPQTPQIIEITEDTDDNYGKTNYSNKTR